MRHRLALIGFGNVGVGLASILVEKRQSLAREHGFEFDVVAISDAIKGTVVDPAGIDLDPILQAGGKLDTHPKVARNIAAIDAIKASDATVVVEATYTDLTTGEPAASHVRAAFETGKHVVTTNKGPLALHYRELTTLAASKGLQFRFEGTVMSGTPLLSLGTRNLSGCDISEIRGIFNGTTNFILTEMEKGNAYPDALKKAQELGYAEADPRGDVDGHDTLGKVLILANVFMGGRLRKEEISRTGITKITPEDVARASAEGKRWKLIGRLRREDGRVTGSVAPEALSLSNPLASVMGATNAAQFQTDLLGEVTIVGAGAGRKETGFAILADLLDIHRTVARS